LAVEAGITKKAFTSKTPALIATATASESSTIKAYDKIGLGCLNLSHSWIKVNRICCRRLIARRYCYP